VVKKEEGGEGGSNGRSVIAHFVRKKLITTTTIHPPSTHHPPTIYPLPFPPFSFLPQNVLLPHVSVTFAAGNTGEGRLFWEMARTNGSPPPSSLWGKAANEKASSLLTSQPTNQPTSPAHHSPHSEE
jgi:hypothetical protein